MNKCSNMKHQGTVKIETKRLILREFMISDTEASYKNWTSDTKITEFLRWQAHENLTVTENVINSWIENYKNKDFYQWAIELKEIEEVIGTISVVKMDEKVNMMHIGYCIGSKWWNNSYTTEAFQAIIKFLFNEVKVNRIESWYDPNNPSSGRVMQKCGLHYEGTLKQSDWSNQGIVDACVYAIIKSEEEISRGGKLLDAETALKSLREKYFGQV